MQFRPWFLAVALLLAAPAAPAQAFFDFGPDEGSLYLAHDGELSALEAALKASLAGEGDRRVVVGLIELQDRLERQVDNEELKLPLRAEFHSRLLKLRADALRAGIEVEGWRSWGPIDGFPEAKEDKLVEEVDHLLYKGLDSHMKEAKALQARLTASSMPMHAFVNQHVLVPAIAGASAKVIRKHANSAIERLTRILQGKMSPHGYPMDEELASAKEEIQMIRAQGGDPAQIPLKVGERRLSLLQAFKEAEPIGAAALKQRNAEEAAEQARVALHRKGLKGDRARLFDREGMPESWMAMKETPETLATARVWRYRVTHDHGYYFVYFHFDAQGRMVKRTVEHQ